MDELVELSSDSSENNEINNIGDELSAILKKYENVTSKSDDKIKISSSKKKRFNNNDLSPSSSETEEILEVKRKEVDKNKKKQEREEKLVQKNEERSKKLAERLQKREENLKAKNEKRILNEIYSSFKPEEAIKQVKCILDTKLSEEIVIGLQEAEINIKRSDFNLKYSKVMWSRDQSKLINLNGDLNINIIEDEKVPVVYIIDHKELLNMIKNNETLTIPAPNETVTLIEIDTNKIQREEEKQIEFALTEVQLVSGWSHRKLKSNAELIELLRQYTKAFALAPSKRLKASNRQNIVLPSGSDCVRVQMNTGHGLGALYLRQLSQFPLASLETAHAVHKLYPTPKSLINSGDNDSVVDLLADSQVRRAVGPLSAPRRLGAQLAKKIHVAFTSRDPNAILS